MFKRLIDLTLSIFGILIVLPLFPIVALIIKLDSRGPIFYLCDRVGKDGKLFRMFKFRTMYTTPINVGPNICPEGDPRITSAGRVLRRTKINEFPQLINILKGEMSFVGPRPEALDLAALYPPQARAIFNVKPGLVGPNQIIGRNEEEWYPVGVEPQKYYIEVILPKKLPIDLEYIKNPSAYIDFKYIILGGKETICKLISWNLILRNKSQIYLLAADIFLINISALIAYSSFLNSEILSLTKCFLLLLSVVTIRTLCFLRFGLYSTLIRYLSFHDVISILKGSTFGSLIIIFISFMFDFSKPSNITFLSEWILLIVMMSLMRTFLRFYWDWNLRSKGKKSKRVLIFGAGDAGALAHRSLATEKTTTFEVIGFLDDDPKKIHKSLYGLKVLGGRYNLDAIVKLYQIDMVFLAMPRALFPEIVKIVSLCKKAGIPYAIFPTLQSPPTSLSISSTSKQLSELFITDPINLDEIELESILKNSTILITGSCNELIIELCQQVLRYSPKHIVIIDQYESQLNELVSRLRNMAKPNIIKPILCGTISNRKISDVFREFQPEITFHTSTRKYRSSFEIPIEDVLRSNYISTFEIAKYASKFNCKYFVMLSSLEAPKNQNPVFDSLRAAEISLQQFFSTQNTKLAIIRLCDIVENRGSIVSLFKSQIENLEPVSIPNPNSSCFIISKYSAARFIMQSLLKLKLCNANVIVDSVPGIPILLIELARKIITLNGLTMNSDISIDFYQDLSENEIDASFSTEDPEYQTNTDIYTNQISSDNNASISNEVSDAINYLLNMTEPDLEYSAWKEYTNKVLSVD